MIVKSKINAILFHVLAHNKSAENLNYQLPALHDQSTTNSNLLKYYLSMIVVSIHYEPVFLVLRVWLLLVSEWWVT